MKIYLSKLYKKKLGKLLGSWRLKKDMQQRICDVKCDFPAHSTSDYECGRIQIPIDKYCVMARVCGRQEHKAFEFLLELVTEDLREAIRIEYSKPKPKSRLWDSGYKKRMEKKWEKTKKLRNALNAQD